jgi:PST family polysaccharide transporter
MFEKCKSLIIKVKTNADVKVLVTNFISLSILQLLNLLLPLITLPYLVKVIGAEKFGVIAFASSLIVYFQAITDYGFSLSGTRQISHNRAVNSELSKIFSRIISIKMFFMIVSFIIFLIIISLFEKFQNDKAVFLLSFISLIGNVFFPEWFFQGIEKMKFITFFNFVSKMLFTISLFIFITEKTDYIFVPLITSLGFLIAGLVAFFYAIIKFNLNFVFTTFKEMKF